MPLKNPLFALQGYQMRRIAAAFNAQLNDKLEALELRIPEASLLLLLQANPGATQAKLARVMAMASANMAPLVSRLEMRGLIRREQLAGRKQALELTQDGDKAASGAHAIMQDHEERWTSLLRDGARFSQELDALAQTLFGEELG